MMTSFLSGMASVFLKALGYMVLAALFIGVMWLVLMINDAAAPYIAPMVLWGLVLGAIAFAGIFIVLITYSMRRFRKQKAWKSTETGLAAEGWNAAEIVEAKRLFFSRDFAGYEEYLLRKSAEIKSDWRRKYKPIDHEAFVARLLAEKGITLDTNT